MKSYILAAAAAALITASAAPAQKIEDAQALKPQADLFRKVWAEQPGKPVEMVLPLYGRLLRFHVPPGYVPAYKVEHRGQFLFEFTQGSETVKDWTRLITIRSVMGLGQSTFSDEMLAETMFNVGACEREGDFRIIDRKKLGGDLSSATLSLACGSLSGDSYLLAKAGAGEQNFIRFFRDKDNVYALAIAVRGAPFAAASPPLSDAEGRKLLAAFGDISLCGPADPGAECIAARAVNAVREGAR